ncbi:unnamed protein product [Sphagnum compactum]
MDAADDGGDEYCGLHNAEKKRRLTFDQVRSLERNFELENKLEPERKMQLAKELGLQPRQVAVWFQNRRARWKTKQLERDYEILTLDYNRLKSEFESVRDEKQELQAKVKWLTEKSTTQPEEESAAGCQPAPIGSYVQQQQSSSKLVETTATTLNHQPGATSNESPSHQLTLPEKPSGVVVEAHVFCRSSSFKLEGAIDGAAMVFQPADQDSCNYLLPQVDENGALPWWDW